MPPCGIRLPLDQLHAALPTAPGIPDPQADLGPPGAGLLRRLGSERLGGRCCPLLVTARNTALRSLHGGFSEERDWTCEYLRNLPHLHPTPCKKNVQNQSTTKWYRWAVGSLTQFWFFPLDHSSSLNVHYLILSQSSLSRASALLNWLDTAPFRCVQCSFFKFILRRNWNVGAVCSRLVARCLAGLCGCVLDSWWQKSETHPFLSSFSIYGLVVSFEFIPFVVPFALRPLIIFVVKW